MKNSSWTYSRPLYNNPLAPEYISFRGQIGKGEVAQTKKLREGLLLDLDAKGNVLGIEIYSAPRPVKKKRASKT